ncbi:MAG: AAA family ATPase, partial [Candidatus Saccharimonadales bacterium]
MAQSSVLASLRLQNFRSYQDASFDFDAGVTIIVGPNASGKTNLLEAVLVVARGTSYRAKDGDLVAFGAPWSRLDAQLAAGGERTIKFIADPVPSKQYELDGKTYK